MTSISTALYRKRIIANIFFRNIFNLLIISFIFCSDIITTVVVCVIKTQNPRS